MHHAIKHPLNVDFNFTSKRKAIHSLLDSDIGEHRLHNGHALRIYLAALVTVGLVLHGFGEIVDLRTDEYIQRATFGVFAVKASAF
jgi:hypothetical protein